MTEVDKGVIKESNTDKLSIRLHVYDTEMSVTIPRADEACYRAGAKLITEVVNSYSSVYKGRKSEKEILYMALIDIVLRYEKEVARHDMASVADILGKLTTEIEEALEEK